jgi:hypothetical protein
MILSAFGLIAATAGCSGDDGGDDTDKAKDDPSSSISIDPKEQRERTAKTTECTAEVRTTGTYAAEWNGAEAQVRTGGKAVDASGPDAVYTLTDKRNRVALYSAGPEFKGSISLNADGLSYSSDPADAESFDIDKRGKHASVDTTLTAIDGEELGLVAEFTCGKSKK